MPATIALVMRQLRTLQEFFFACNRGQRAVRVQQYQQQPEAEQAPTVRDATARRTKPPLFRTVLREPIARMSSIDDSTASEPQASLHAQSQ